MDRLGFHKTFLAAQTRFLNELLCRAIARVTGAAEINPYDYLNRMAKREDASGMTVYLDKSPILWVGPCSARDSWRGRPSQDFQVIWATPYRFLGHAQVSL